MSKKRGPLPSHAWVPGLLALGATLAYFVLALFRHLHFESGAHDLGLFTQAVWAYSRFETPASSILGLPHVWGDHFHPFLMGLAPLFWIHPGPETLLLVQSAALGLSLIPVYRFSESRLGAPAALPWSLAYALFWGLQIAAFYDFHDIVIAVPVAAWAILFLDRGRLGPFAACLGGLLLIRENLALLAAVMALGLIPLKKPRLALGLAFVSLLWFLVAVLGLIPAFAPPGRGFSHWNYPALGEGPLEGIQGLIRRPWLAFSLLLDEPSKIRTLVRSFGAYLFLPLLSPLSLFGAPLFAERFWSSKPHLWHQGYHYSAVIAPILAMAGADGASRLLARLPKAWSSWRPGLGLSLGALILALGRLHDLPLRFLAQSSYYQLSESDLSGRRALALVPKTASVAAQDKILAHFSCREGAFVLDKTAPQTDYIVASKSVDPEPFLEFGPLAEILSERLEADYELVFRERGWLVLRRRGLD